MGAMVLERALVGLLLVASLWSATPNIAVGANTHFLLPDGDNVTCIPIEAQVSLGGNKTYNRYPTTVIIPGNSTAETYGAKLAQQTIALVAGGCRNGTIPVRGAVQGVSARVPSTKTPPGRSLASQATISPPHEYAAGELNYSSAPGTYKGTEVFLNIWKPYVANLNEFSLGQLALTAGPNTMEAGFQILRLVGGDYLPRLFIYWTADNYATTGCYDLGCPGFVQVSNKVLIGGSFANISETSGQQYDIKLRVFKLVSSATNRMTVPTDTGTGPALDAINGNSVVLDDGTGDWWLQLNDESVGYWPKDIYKIYPFQFAKRVIWYGEIIDDEQDDGNVHTSTQMGSGHFAKEGHCKAAYMRNLQYINQNNGLVDAPFSVSSPNTNTSCYSVEKGTNISSWGSSFYYGGPGRSANNTACLHNSAYTNP